MGVELVLSLLGGLALFMYGMQMMSTNLEAVAGNRMKQILERLTANRFLGVLVGAGITALIQSSSATTVMTVGFVNSGLMTLKQAVWIIMGANVGTTITGQLIALDIGALAPLIAFVGVMSLIFAKIKGTACGRHYCRYRRPVHRHGHDERCHGSAAGFRNLHPYGDQIFQSPSGNPGRSGIHSHYPVLVCVCGYPSGSGYGRRHQPSQCRVRAVRPEYRYLYYSASGFCGNQPQCKAHHPDSSDVQCDWYGPVCDPVHPDSFTDFVVSLTPDNPVAQIANVHTISISAPP